MVVLLYLFSFFLSAHDSFESLTSQLETSQGKEKLSILAKLAQQNRKENPKQAIIWGMEALKLLETFPDKKLQASILNNLSHAYRFLNNINKEKEYAQQSLEISKANNDKPNIADALNSLGKVCTGFGEFDQAQDYYLKSAQIYKELHDYNNHALAFNSIAGIYWQKGDYVTALQYLFQSLEIYEEKNDLWGISAINANIGVIYWQLNDVEKSLEHHLKSLQIFIRLKDNNSISMAHTNIGLIYFKQKKYPEALKEFKTALDLNLELDIKSNIASNYYNIGRVHKDLNDNKIALSYFEKSLNLRKALNEKKGIAATLIHIASINQRYGKYDIALEQASQGLNIAKEINIKEEISDAYLVLSGIYESLQDFQKALDLFKKFKEVKDTILNDETTRQIANMQTNFDIQQRQKEIELLTKDKEIQRTVLIFLILFALLIVLLAFVIYTRYRLKSKSNLALEKEIDERKLTELKLRESEEKFRVLAEKSVVGIWIIQDGVIKYANPRSSAIFGYPITELINRNPMQLILEDDQSIVSESLKARLDGSSTTLAYEYRGLNKEGDVINLESYGSLTHYKGQPAVLESIIDITRRKKTDSELIKSRKMESVGILAGGIAHDFNNLLAVIIGNASMLKLSYSDLDDKFNNFVNNVEKASSQAADLAQKFITFSEGGWLMRKKVKIANILKDTIHLSPELKNISCDISFPNDLDYIFGDERQLRQVMTNLLINAYEAINTLSEDEEKKIIVNAVNTKLDKDNPYSVKEGDYVNISVIDNGKGIPDEILEKIFDPYFSTKNTVSQKGLGLGLAICYSIVKKHGGHIIINSKVKKGTTVNLYLPAISN